jgi:small multidrug resistance pump
MRWLFLLLGIASNSSASLLIKLALQSPRGTSSFHATFSNIHKWPFIVGILLYATALIFYALSLKYFPLNIAHPVLTSGAIATVAFLSVVVLGEPLRPLTLIALMFITFGVILLAIGTR